MMNTEKIIQRIRQLFKNHYFYTKDHLIREINVVRQYPLVQIYAALNRLVNDSSEFITDRYDRQGHLINIGQYYYFQPLEITDERISVFERSAPLEYKRNTIDISLPSDVSETMVKKVENIDAPVEKVVIVTNAIADKLIATMKEDYDNAMTTQMIVRGEDNWYKYCSLTINKLIKKGISKELLSKFLVAHIIEMMLFTDKLIILEFVFSKESLTDFENAIKEYFNKYMMQTKGLTAILLENNGVQQMMMNKGNSWVEAQPQDYKDMQTEITKYIVTQSDMASIMGFIISFKDKYMIFKVKDMTLKRHKGARCDQAGKADTIKLLNKTVEEDIYTNQNTRDMVQMELCSLQEFLLRYFDSIKKDGKRWFLTPEESIINNIQTIKI